MNEQDQSLSKSTILMHISACFQHTNRTHQNLSTFVCCAVEKWTWSTEKKTGWKVFMLFKLSLNGILFLFVSNCEMFQSNCSKWKMTRSPTSLIGSLALSLIYPPMTLTLCPLPKRNLMRQRRTRGEEDQKETKENREVADKEQGWKRCCDRCGDGGCWWKRWWGRGRGKW